MARAQQIPIKHPRNAAVSFAAELETGETLTGTPTVTSTPSGLTIDNVRVNSADVAVAGRVVAIGEAVQFRVTGGASDKTYQLTVTCSTTAFPSQTLVAECILKVIDL